MAKHQLHLPSSPKASTDPDPKNDRVAALGLPVLVKTTEKISGQDEHAAIITRVFSDDLVNVMVFPGEGQPYTIASIRNVKSISAGSLCWRWP